MSSCLPPSAGCPVQLGPWVGAGCCCWLAAALLAAVAGVVVRFLCWGCWGGLCWYPPTMTSLHPLSTSSPQPSRTVRKCKQKLCELCCCFAAAPAALLLPLLLLVLLLLAVAALLLCCLLLFRILQAPPFVHLHRHKYVGTNRIIRLGRGPCCSVLCFEAGGGTT